MKDRRFTDGNGTEWRVYVVVTAPKIAPLQPPLSLQFRPVKTALAFESATQRRRLTPAPPGWEHATPQELEGMLGRAIITTISAVRGPGT
jgi:hypothetical protein